MTATLRSPSTMLQHTPVSLLDFSRPFAIFEDNLDTGGGMLILSDLHASFVASTEQQIHAVFAQLEGIAASGGWIAIAANYEVGYQLEPRLNANRHASQALFRAWAFRQGVRLAGEAASAWWQAQLTAMPPQQAEAGLLKLEPGLDEASHYVAIRKILKWIGAGDCYQVNLTFPMNGVCHGSPFALFAQLRQTQPVRYGALLHTGEDWILSRSPELFFSRRGNQLECRPMKGTQPRSADADEDARNAAMLLSSDKDRAENLMIVDLIRNDLGRLCPPGGVSVPSMFDLETYSSVYQLTSTVRAAPVEAGMHEIFRALFPCGSVTGAPKVRAMEIIAELEDAPRGIYCGALGWFAPSGDALFNVPIRTLTVDADSRCRLNVGSGIVADSSPAAEYRECLAKARFALGLASDIKLIETMCWNPTEGIPLLERHLARLQRSAIELGFAFDEARIRTAIGASHVSLPPLPHRLRLLLERDGSCRLELALLEPMPALVHAAIWHAPLVETDPKLRYKTTARTFYNQGMKAAIDAGCFDVLFFNRRGELCEGTRSNVFLERGGRLLTPATQCGLLPGVMRGKLLDEGRAEEALLTRKDLQNAESIWLTNALRGLFRVNLKSAVIGG